MRDSSGLDLDVLNSLSGLAWVVDGQGCIQSYGARNWNAFALSNGAPEWADADRVVGTRLLDQIHGADLVQMYRRMMDAILTGQSDEISFGLACDSPTQMRQMRLSLTPVWSSGRISGILFQSVQLRSEMRPAVNLFDAHALEQAWMDQDRLPLVAVCSLCQHVHLDGVGWVSPEQYYRLGGVSRIRPSHTICPHCHNDVRGPS